MVLTATRPELGPGRYTWHVGDLRTGRITATLPLASTSWSTAIDDAGSLSGSLPLASGLWTDIRAWTAPGQSFLAVAYLDSTGYETFLAGGPIWTRRLIESSGMLTLGAAGLWSYYDHRKLIDAAGLADPARSTLTYSAVTLATIAKRLIQVAAAHTGGALPVVLPDDVTAAADEAHTRTYPGYELAWIGDRLRQLTAVQGGPEIQFVPRRRVDDPRFLEWVMRAGTEAAPLLTQAGADHVFTHGVPKSAVRDLDIAEDASSLGFRAWVTGEGEAEGKPIARVDALDLVNSGYPLLEVEDTTAGSVSSPGTLTARAAELASAATRPVETWKATVDRDSPPTVGIYTAGDWCRFRVGPHPLLDAGEVRRRITSVSGDDTGTVVLELAPTVGGL